ncbi:MAG: class I SAM-dependent methyltransferase [Candidatus Binatia bacterium]
MTAATAQDIRLFATWLRRASLRLHRLAEPPWWLLKRLCLRQGYWDRRKDLNYYRAVIELSRKHVPAGAHVIDVGALDTGVLAQLDWFPHRVALDVAYVPPRRRIQRVRMDFLDYHPPVSFDLVLCLQTLEHLKAPRPFARKLLETGKTIIISVPYKWPAGTYAAHRQDPVDEAKLKSWTGRDPIETLIARDGRERLIAVFSQ